jgi:dTDP-4-dehydrorhamnose 3,5-epimerase-like enzyme
VVRWEISAEKKSIEDVRVIRSDIFQDERGLFTEIYGQDKFRELGLPEVFEKLRVFLS